MRGLEALLLSLVNLSKRFGDIVALEGASFDVPSGRIVGFLGPNGAGKTTAMRCIFDLVRPDTGEVLWGGAPVGPAERLRFGYMPEERGLYPKMKVADQLAYFARLSGKGGQEAKDDAASWLTRLGLIDRSESKLEELSHGNQQRVQLAAALVHNPELAVLDEPFAGLDPIGMESMAQTLRDLAGRGVGIVFSSHQLDTVEDLCQDVVIIDRGRVVLTGELTQLRAGARIRHLVIEVDDQPWSPDGDDATVVVTRTGDRRLLVQPDVDLDALLAEARAAGTVTRFSFEPPSLSDLFREAIQ
jgi:ABC-2 type transport system ATP-binding protein